MEKIKMFFKSLWAHRIFKIITWAFLILVILYFILVGFRVKYFFDLDKTNAQVEKIHATKLTLDDVMGTNLPPEPGALADKTVQGIDANNNGIRDDVELAVFQKYPNSAKTRAVLLQYALALQMEFMQPIVNTTITTEVITENSRGHTCIGDVLVPRKDIESSRSSAEVNKIYEYIDFIENKQFNTDARKKANQDFYKNLRSYGESTNKVCDIDISKLQN
ncbi:MAG: hypothetical protein WC793_02425 [Candidatus Paceibacterota bacterium]|jgi:hypothetical protein